MLRRITLPVFLTYLAFAAQSVDANPIRYVAIGDSYTVATGIEEKDSWPSQLTQKLKSAGIEINLIEILGMKGATSQQTLNEVMPLLKNLIDEIQSNLPPKKLLLITIPDFSCSPQKKNWGYGKSATNGITRLNKILKTEAALRDLVIVDIYPLSQNLCSQVGMFSDDGVHPSALQYSKWVDLIFPHLIDNLKLKSKDLKKS